MKKMYTNLLALLLIISMIWVESSTALAVDKNIKKSLFRQLTEVKTEPPAYTSGKDTPEGLCIVGNTAYTTKIHSDGTTSIIKTINIDGTPKNIMPEKNLSLSHANDLTYYNGYLYVAGMNNKFYRVKDNGINAKGKERYSVKTYSVSGMSLSAKYGQRTWNITHFTGKYFIFCASIESLKLTYGVGYFDDAKGKFVVTKTFYGKARAFTTIQGLTYRDGYLYQATSDNDGTFKMNKISEFKIGKTYDGITKGKQYSLAYYGTFDDKSFKRYEIESMDFDSKGKLYVLINIAIDKDKNKNKSNHDDLIYVSKYPIGGYVTLELKQVK